ncbi:MAG TPA: PHP domain-containing protein [Coriobacteriia bacterium]
MTIDLHVHTTASDGLLRPADIVARALDLELRVISITDHDSVAGIDEACEAAAGTTLEVIPGVELSVHATGGGDAHILGYFVDQHDDALLVALSRLQTARFDRAVAMVDALRTAGHAISLDDVLGYADGGAVGRVHVARALVAARSVDTIEEAFAELIGRDGPFYVRKALFLPRAALDAIHGAGGVAVLAHPGVSGEGPLVGLVAEGLDGIEAYHADHTRPQRDHFVSVARRFGLIVTGGSDFHGPGLRSASLGSGSCPPEVVEALRERATILRP